MAAAVVVVLLLAGWLMLRPDEEPPGFSQPQPDVPERTVRPSKSPSPSAQPGPGDPTVGAQLGLPGLQGNSTSISYPGHEVVLTLSSSRPLPFVRYFIPTSRGDRGGTKYDLGPRWRAAATAYGEPDYAWVFSIADPHGTPITCTITVDGKVTAQMTSEGPYGKLFCQG